MDKKVKNLVIATFIFLGTSYALEKYVKTKKRQKEIENSKIMDELNNKVSNETNYILLGELYNDIATGKIKLEKVANKENLEDINAAKRR